MYLVIFWKLLNFIFRLTPHNLQKSLAFSSWVFYPLTGFVGITRHAYNNIKVSHDHLYAYISREIFGSNWLI